MPPFYQMRLSNERLTRDNMQSCLIVVLFLVNVNVGLILSSDTFEIFSLMFIQKISGINPVSTSAVCLSVIVKFKILHLVETLPW